MTQLLGLYVLVNPVLYEMTRELNYCHLSSLTFPVEPLYNLHRFIVAVDRPVEYERISLASITDAALEERSQNDMPEATQVASNDRHGYYVYNAEPAKKSDHQAFWVAAVSLLLLLSIGVLHHLSLRAVARSAVFQHTK